MYLWDMNWNFRYSGSQLHVSESYILLLIVLNFTSDRVNYSKMWERQKISWKKLSLFHCMCLQCSTVLSCIMFSVSNSINIRRLLIILNRVLLELLEVLEVLARRVSKVLQESLDCLELQLLQGIQDLPGHQDLLALKVKTVTRVTKVIVVNQDFLDSLAQLDFLAEKVCKAKREIRSVEAC